MPNPSKEKAHRPRLGRGLSSLITNSAALTHSEGEYEGVPPVTPEPTGTLAVPADTMPNARTIRIDDISPNPFQPRREFLREELAQLADSIRMQGILQPIVVAQATDAGSAHPFVLIAGERRLRAARIAELDEVPCVIRTASRQEMLELAIVENIHRADLNAIERAEAYRQYIDRFDFTQADAAERLGQPRATIANYLRLLELGEATRRLVADGRLSFGHAKVLVALAGDPRRELALAEKTVAEGLSVRRLEELVAAEKSAAGETPDAREPEAKPGKPALVRDLEDRLSRSVATRVRIFPGRAKHSGRIVLYYYNLDDFDRLAASLGMEAEA